MRTSGLHTCPLCGYTFNASEMACHTSCPLSVGCHLICCPNCGYQVPDEQRMIITGTLRRVWDALRHPSTPPTGREGEAV